MDSSESKRPPERRCWRTALHQRSNLQCKVKNIISFARAAKMSDKAETAEGGPAAAKRKALNRLSPIIIPESVAT